MVRDRLRDGSTHGSGQGWIWSGLVLVGDGSIHGTDQGWIWSGMDQHMDLLGMDQHMDLVRVGSGQGWIWSGLDLVRVGFGRVGIHIVLFILFFLFLWCQKDAFLPFSARVLSFI